MNVLSETAATTTALMTVALTESLDSSSPLAAGAEARGLAALAEATWPESEVDAAAPALAGFVVSSFSPIVAEVARRCLRRRPLPVEGADQSGNAEITAATTAVIVVSPMGDLTSAVHVAAAVDAGSRVSPLLFFQSVPNAVAGYVATRAQLTGPVVCVADLEAGLDIAALLIEDGDADEALLLRIELAYTGDTQDRADAVLLTARSPHSAYSEGEEP